MAKKKSIDLPTLEQEYKTLVSVARSFSTELTHQMESLLESQGAALGFPIQHRVKEWESIVDKFERVPLHIESLKELQDFVGLRLILLFKRDIAKVRELILRNFKVIREYDTQERLKEDQFGYSSLHFIVELRPEWLAVPTLSQMVGLRAELQVRTIAQHIWAAASHTLQYKQKQGVPPSVLRGIYRVSALLETVDLEFERVLIDRETYRIELDILGSAEVLNVDSLEKTLDSLLPLANKDGDQEDYADILEELVHFGITTAARLRELFRTHLEQVLIEDKKNAAAFARLAGEGKVTGSMAERVRSGVFLTHVGMARVSLKNEFGSKWTEYEAKKGIGMKIIKKEIEKLTES